MLRVNSLIGFGGRRPAGPPSEFSFVAAQAIATDLTTYTFDNGGGNFDFGADDANRRITAAIAWRSTPAQTVSSLTIGGVGATAIVTGVTGLSAVAIYIANVPTGANGTVVITFSGTALRCGVGVYRMVNSTSTATATDTDVVTNSDPASLSVNVTAGGAAIAVATHTQGGTATWAGVTERYDAAIEGSTIHTGAFDKFVGSQSPLAITADYSATPITNQCAAVASWPA
jgi:hypothetical protein